MHTALHKVNFFTGPTQKVVSMEKVPPNSEKLLSSRNIAKIPKKGKVLVKACQTLSYSAKVQQTGKV